MKNNIRIYHFFFPKGKVLPFKKARWTVMIVIQEMLMCKWKAIFRMFYDVSYRKNIYHLRDILSKAPLQSEKTTMKLSDINFSHGINYPEWVAHLTNKLIDDENDYKRIKVFFDETIKCWIVIDGNHRLRALKNTQDLDKEINVLKLSYR